MFTRNVTDFTHACKLALLIFSVALSACGPIDGDDPELEVEFAVKQFHTLCSDAPCVEDPQEPLCIPEHFFFCQPVTGYCWDVCTCVNTGLPCP